MTAAVKNLDIEQKATFLKKLTFRDKFKKPINLTGYEARMQIKATDGSLIADLSTENGKIEIDGALGTILLTIPDSETKLMTFTTANYDLKLIAPGGISTRLLKGKVTLDPGQTD